MDFFGFAASADLSTPVGAMVKSATDSLLLGPDWSKNLEISDMISNSKEGSEQAIKAITRRLQDSDQNTVYLSLIIFETCFKNCGTAFVAQVNRSAMDELVAVAKGSRGDRNAQEALRLIQEWGRAYESRRNTFPIFFDTFMALKSKGFPFPREEPAVVFSPPSRTPSNSFDGRQLQQQQQESRSQYRDSEVESGGSQEESGRLERDLTVVMEKVRLCREMLLVSPGIAQDETLADVVGFLEACRDRLAEVVEAGTQGLLGEELFEAVLKANDAVLRTLDAERNGTHIGVDDDENSRKHTSESKTNEASGNLLDLSLNDSPVASSSSSSAPRPVSLLSQAEDDVFGQLDGKSAVKVGGAGAKKAPVKSSVITAPVVAPVQPTAEALAFDPFSTQAPPPPPAVVSAPLATPTPFDEMLAPPPAVPAAAPPAAPGTMTDADFDAFFNNGKK